MPPTTVPAIMGTSSFGTDKGFVSSITDLAVAQRFIEVAVKRGCSTLDSARVYGAGESEEMLSKLDLMGLKVDTKIFCQKPGDFAPDKLKEQVAGSMKALGGVPIRALYFHNMDRATPLEEQLQAMDGLHKQGVYEEFGLCNCFAWEVAEIWTMCKERGWVRPTVYQGIYNALDRVIEDELLPCLRKFGIRFSAYSPLAGGLLTGFHLEKPELLESNVRFRSSSMMKDWYGSRYAYSEPVLRRVKTLADSHNITLTEVGVRWLVHHSQMRPDDNGICYGGRTPEQVDTALSCHAQGPLPDDIVKMIDAAWTDELKGKVGSYAIS